MIQKHKKALTEFTINEERETIITVRVRNR